MDNHNKKSDRDLLIEIHSAVAVLNERTKAIPRIEQHIDELQDTVARHDSDIKWLKRIAYSVVPVIGICATVIGGWLKWLGGVGN